MQQPIFFKNSIYSEIPLSYSEQNQQAHLTAPPIVQKNQSLAKTYGPEKVSFIKVLEVDSEHFDFLLFVCFHNQVTVFKVKCKPFSHLVLYEIVIDDFGEDIQVLDFKISHE